MSEPAPIIASPGLRGTAQMWGARLSRWAATPVGKRVITAARWLTVLAVVVYLIDHLADVGWREVWRALPTNPWFYILFLAGYLVLPLCEVVIYRAVWRAPMGSSLPVFVRKMVYNDVMDYSGEAYLMLWARRTLGLEPKRAFSTVKDVNILSGLASNTMTLAVLAVFIGTGQVALLLKTNPDSSLYLWITGLLALAIIALILLFRRRIFALPGGLSWFVFGMHIVRVVAGLGLLALQWAAALPGVVFSVWLFFLTARLLLSRIPFLPNRELMFMGLALGLSGLVNVPQADITGLFVAGGALALALNLAMFLFTSFGGRARQDAAGQQATPELYDRS
jgi:hypothetical protein